MAHYPFNSPASVLAAGNLYWRTEGHACAGNVCGEDPRVADARLPTFDGTPLAGSAAVDRVPTLVAIPTDLRGVPRPFGPASDIGAIEARPLPPLGGPQPPQDAGLVGQGPGPLPAGASVVAEGGWRAALAAWARRLAGWAWRYGPSRAAWWLAEGQ